MTDSLDSDLNIKKASNAELSELGKAHLLAFKNNFMSMMGLEFLIDYYSFSIESQYSDVFYVDSEDMFSWMVVYYDPIEFMKEYKKLRWSMIFNVTRSIIRKPSILVKLISAVYKVISQSNSDVSLKDDYVEIAIVGSKVQGKGNTKLLMEAFLAKNLSTQFKGYKLEVDESNFRAIKFYELLGFQLVAYLKRGQRLMQVMELKK